MIEMIILYGLVAAVLVAMAIKWVIDTDLWLGCGLLALAWWMFWRFA